MPFGHSASTELEKRVSASRTDLKPQRKYFRWEAIAAGIMVLVPLIGAIAIPNLMQSRTAANEAAEASTVLTLNTVQFTYSNKYPLSGFAPNLAALGPGADGHCGGGPSRSHACLIDASLGCTAGTSRKWCVKDAFRYSITGSCQSNICVDYVIVATPVNPTTGAKNFCSITDAVIRYQTGPPLASPVTQSKCKSWAPL